MKGWPGLITAVVLGVLAAGCNWFYLYNKARQIEMVEFIGIAAEKQLEAGERFQEQHLTKIPVPQDSARALELAAYHWQDRNTVVGMTAHRRHREGEILLRQDLRTPPQTDPREQLGPDEVAHYVPIDLRRGVPEQIPIGSRVSFLVPKMGSGAPSPVNQALPAAGTAGSNGSAIWETIGPFRVISVGNRLGSVSVHKSFGQSLSQASVLGIAVNMRAGEFEPKAQKLLDRIAVFQQPLAYVLHGKTKPGQ